MSTTQTKDMFVVIAAYDRKSEVELEDSTIFFGTREQCEAKFEELLSDGEDCDYYLAKVVRQAVPSFEFIEYGE